MGLTAKQQVFVDVYDGNATEAAIKAGYSKKSARAIGQENLTKPDIVKAIQERESKRIKPLIADRERRQRFWTQVMDDPEVEMRDRLTASKLLGQSEGDFLDRVEASVELSPASILETIRQRRT